MPSDFDPYYTWLSIAPDEHPPTHYRLLGLRTFEDNPEVIENASDQRMAHLRKFQSGKHSRESQKLLNEVAAAKVCLMNPEKRGDYDQDLREMMQAAAAGTGREDDVSATLAGFLQQVEAEKGGPAPSQELAPEPLDTARRGPNRAILIACLLGGVVFLLLTGTLFTIISRRQPADDDQQVAKADKDRQAGQQQKQKQKSQKHKGQKHRGQQDQGQPDQGQQDTSAPQPSPKGPPAERPTKKPVRRTLADLVDKDGSPEPVSPVEPPPDGPRPADVPPSAPREKIPLPSSEAQEEVNKQLDEIYDLSKGRTPSENRQLARNLFQLGKNTKNNPPEKYVLLRKAAELAGKGGNAAVMIDAVDAMGNDFEIETLVVQGKMLSTFAEKARDSGAIGSLVTAAQRYAEKAIAAKQYDYATKIAGLVFRTCQRSGGKEFRKSAFELRQRVQKIHDEHEKFETATLAIKANPDDQDAHLALGRLYCFDRRDWRDGLPHLAKGSDPDLSIIAGQELRSPGEPGEQLALGDAWWKLAAAREGDEKESLLLHAGTWYRRAQRGLHGLDKAKVAKRLEQIAEIEQPAKPARPSPKPRPPTPRPGRPRYTGPTKPIVIADFESKGPWQATGKAFGGGPSTGREMSKYPARGFNGRHLISSYHGGDGSTGTLLSRPFRIERPVISFLIGGGKYANQTCLNLVVDGKAVRTATGRNSNTLAPGEWDVSELIGKNAQIQVLDNHTGSWGHILADDIIQRVKKPSRESHSPGRHH